MNNFLFPNTTSAIPINSNPQIYALFRETTPISVYHDASKFVTSTENAAPLLNSPPNY